MAVYITLVAILALLSVLEQDPKVKWPGQVAALLLILFGGLRYETGFDWVEYESYFDLMQPIWSKEPQYVESSLAVEPGFALLTLLIRSLAIPFQGLLFAITAINITIIYFFARRYTHRLAFCLFVYYGFVFLGGQMAAVRQTLSYSFILLAFVQRDQGRYWRSIWLIAIATSIHTFSIVFGPLIFLRKFKIPFFAVVILVATGVATALYGFYIVPLAAEFVSSVMGGGFLATKLTLYGDYEGAALSYASLSLIPLHLLVFYLLNSVDFELAKPKSTLTYFTISVTLLSLLCHSYLGLFPALWNRVGYLTFLLQPIALAQRYRAYLVNKELTLLVSGLVGVASTVMFVYTFSSPTSLPFIPYQNAAVVWLTNNPGDGRSRYSYALRQAEIESANKRR